MLIPALVLVIIYRYGSMLGVVMAFQKFSPAKGFFRSPWIGLNNFRNLFTMPNIWQIIYNTVFISFFKMTLGIIVPVVFACLMVGMGYLLTYLVFPCEPMICLEPENNVKARGERPIVGQVILPNKSRNGRRPGNRTTWPSRIESEAKRGYFVTMGSSMSANLSGSPASPISVGSPWAVKSS